LRERGKRERGGKSERKEGALHARSVMREKERGKGRGAFLRVICGRAVLTSVQQI
jgi:hypothetical protein